MPNSKKARTRKAASQTTRTKKAKRARGQGTVLRTVTVSEAVAKQVRDLLHAEMGAPHDREGERMMAYCAYYDPPGLCVCYGF